MKYYIYMYLDLDNVSFYIGKGRGYRYKVSEHLLECRHQPFLQNKIRKIGVDNIKIQFLHKNLTEKEAFKKEKYWIKYYGRRDLKRGTLCNLTNGGEGTSGYKHSKEVLRKMGEAHKGKKHSEETRRKMSVAKVSVKFSMETKRKISATLKGVKLSEETKRKMRKAHKGFSRPSHTEETEQKISNSRKGRKLSEETKRKISESKKVRA